MYFFLLHESFTKMQILNCHPHRLITIVIFPGCLQRQLEAPQVSVEVQGTKSFPSPEGTTAYCDLKKLVMKEERKSALGQ